MRRILVLGCAVVAGCATRQAVPAPAPTAQVDVARARSPSLCFVDGQETDCRDVRAISPGRIDRIEVIKGPTAVSNYGNRAAGGVILVHTKR